MEIQKDTMENVTVFRLKGRLDASSSKQIKENVKTQLEAGVKDLIFDMKGVDFIDSTGLGSLVAALRSVNKEGGEIKISGLQERVRVIFELTRLHRIFDIFDSSIDAAGAFSS